jgi:hypothetical protein
VKWWRLEVLRCLLFFSRGGVVSWGKRVWFYVWLALLFGLVGGAKVLRCLLCWFTVCLLPVMELFCSWGRSCYKG